MLVNNNKAKLLLIQCVDNACKLIAHGKSPDIKPMQGVNMGYIDDSDSIEYEMHEVLPIHTFVELNDEE